MQNTSILPKTKPEILVIKIHQRNVKIPSEEAKLTKLNCSLHLESITHTFHPERAEIVRIWHVALRGGSSFPCECRVAPDCTKPSWKCSSLGLLWERPAHLLALTAELWSQPQRWPHWEEASQQFLSLAHQHHSLSQLENLVLWLRLFTRNQLLRVTSPFKYGDVPPLDHLTFSTKRQTKKKKNYSELVSKLMTHLLQKARSCHFPQNSLDTQSKRTW